MLRGYIAMTSIERISHEDLVYVLCEKNNNRDDDQFSMYFYNAIGTVNRIFDEENNNT